jgi:DNA polymerase III epsilon subunit-like protein
MQGVQFVALDCETTGIDSERDSVIEVGAVKFSLEKNLATFDSLFNPGVRLPSFVSRLTGITDIELQSAPKIAE